MNRTQTPNPPDELFAGQITDEELAALAEIDAAYETDNEDGDMPENNMLRVLRGAV
jgi:hypothetical protein